VGLALLAAAAGFFVARSGGGRAAPVPLSRHAANGLIQVAFPADWRRSAARAPALLRLTEQLAVAPGGDTGRGLVIGRSAATGDQRLLPTALLSALARAPVPGVVVLGKLKWYRYLNLSPRGGGPPRESIYALPTSRGTVLATCIGPADRMRLISSCERILSTLRLISSTALTPGPDVAYARALNAVIAKLNTIRTRAGTQLRAGGRSAAARAAATLAAAHTSAAGTLGRLDAGSAQAANRALTNALRMTGAAYAALGSAAASQAPARYRSARASLVVAMQALGVAFAQLSRLGYPVS
jgi:hypothetical protein